MSRQQQKTSGSLTIAENAVNLTEITILHEFLKAHTNDSNFRNLSFEDIVLGYPIAERSFD